MKQKYLKYLHFSMKLNIVLVVSAVGLEEIERKQLQKENLSGERTPN
jgi:hypothetical protein